MAPRGEITLTVIFGPAGVRPRRDPTRAPNAGKLEQLGAKTYRATFTLGIDPDAYGRALDLVQMVYGWRSTLVEVGRRSLIPRVRPA